MPRKRKKQKIKLILHPPPESLNFTEEDVREKLKPLVRLLARQAAREHWEKTLEAHRAPQRRASPSDDRETPDNELTKPDGAKE